MKLVADMDKMVKNNKNKVYVLVFNIHCEDTLVKGIFETKEKAEEVREKLLEIWLKHFDKDVGMENYYKEDLYIIEVELNKEYEDIKQIY